MSTDLTLAERRERQLAHDAAKTEHEQQREELLSRPRRDEAALERIAHEAEERFGNDPSVGTDDVLAWVSQEFGYRTAVACSMADAVLPHVVARHIPWVDTLFLDTGYHFSETIGTRDAVESSMELTIVDVLPKRTVAEQDAELGKDLFARDPALCCQLRKVEPLSDSLSGYEVWITGVRRDEGPTRADTPWVTWDAKNRLVKVNPLADWTFDEVLAYADEQDVIVNPLVTDGYPSIGCLPCTRKVAEGEDPRAGRWAGFNKTECGLHT
ncbi:phosphoadenosine phosphosulfate reductase [Aeromicrobium sp. Root495]|uniref:phosphoadenylyl-sulfate reductase n=1 Tax=Aeromicrobium sp. Root495 TaxID=1736550 RepID=UPI0006F8763E|nr:phosphoadenylyl-sulfate reductase [Aeromicrobium sp. Root495]KQY59243.1 phosphoadenosine phosphosulfate reductase [Aeromicrobium sp. Root495]